MASKKSLEKSKEIISYLAAKHPHTFSLSDAQIRPLASTILDEIVFHERLPQEVVKTLNRAIIYYKSWTPYLLAVAFNKKKRNLAGIKVEPTTLQEREDARCTLIERGVWSASHEHAFRYHQHHLPP